MKTCTGPFWDDLGTPGLVCGQPNWEEQTGAYTHKKRKSIRRRCSTSGWRQLITGAGRLTGPPKKRIRCTKLKQEVTTNGTGGKNTQGRWVLRALEVIIQREMSLLFERNKSLGGRQRHTACSRLDQPEKPLSLERSSVAVKGFGQKHAYGRDVRRWG